MTEKGLLTPSDETFTPGIDRFSYADLYRPERLKALAGRFDEALKEDDAALFDAFLAYRTGTGAPLTPPEESELLIRVAPHLSGFIARLFRVDAERARMIQQVLDQKAIFRFKKEFIAKQVLKKYNAEMLPSLSYRALDRKLTLLLEIMVGHLGSYQDMEQVIAVATCRLLDAERALSFQIKRNEPAPEVLLEQIRALRQSLLEQTEGREAFKEMLGTGFDSESPDDLLSFTQGLLTFIEKWAFASMHDPAGRAFTRDWVSYRHPHKIDYFHLVEIEAPKTDLPEWMKGPETTLRRRDGFALTDRRYDEKNVLYEIDYCVICHEREKDSCAKGLRDRAGAITKNPLGIDLPGCPLDEKISEMHYLKGEGDAIAALAMAMIDNPVPPATGHRICNDCMKACIYQKQEPVNIPQVETGVLTDVLNLPYGFEIYSLLARWNPLRVKRPYPLPYNGKNVLVVGMGPAGFTLGQLLLNEGFGVVGIDGLKIEPLPKEWTGDAETAPRPIKEIQTLYHALDERVLAGFGGVAEYGITVRWDKNFLDLIYLTLARREKFRVYGGVRFGGTITIDDAWAMGFDHIAIAAGAGRPTIVEMKNNLIKGIRQASDFLMALQLTGAFKASSLANLQLRLPAVIIGGGLTAIDTATEAMAYYPIQVEKTLHRYEILSEHFGVDKVRAMYDEEEKSILDEFLAHGKAIRAERARAEVTGEAPNFVPLLREWGGVSLVYRRDLIDSPAYRLNHEEIIKSLEEGIFYVERMNPVEAIPDRFGAVSAVKFEKQVVQEGKLKGTGEFVTFPAKAVLVAAGTTPNVIYEKEHPGTFQMDEKKKFFKRFEPTWNGSETPALAPSSDWTTPAVFTSYEKEGKFITYYGDNHPVFAGSVVKAMASAKEGYPYIVQLFEKTFAALSPNDQPAREERFNAFAQNLDAQLSAKVVDVVRLTPTIVEVIIQAPLQARQFEPGQFYRLQNFESLAEEVDGIRLTMEGIALTGAWVDKEKGLLSLIALEMGVSSRLCAALKPGEPVVVMGPTGAPTEIESNETVLLAGGGLGNAVLFSIGKAMRARGNRVIYFAGYKKPEDVYKTGEIESASDLIVWSVDSGTPIQPRRPQDKSFVGNIVQAMKAYSEKELGEVPIPLDTVNRIIAIGSDRMMGALQQARHTVLAPYLNPNHTGIGSINSPMQCMMKEVCAQCLQKHIDPRTGKETVVFTCFNQDQKLDHVDFKSLNDRLKLNTVQEKMSNLMLDYLLSKKNLIRV
ncbi:MAG: pyridine nucleotide-disulfide oxidoreductase [Nitrospirae bacterium]|nr:pyridine nucleotide-disulfide oxidoreductase [Candidatus Manganitrophaceae bacterium]